MIYISGGITENPGYMDQFTAAKVRLEARGYDVKSPAHEIKPEMGKSWEAYMADALDLMGECDSIYMLRGWEKSRGARLEHAIAVKANMLIFCEA